MLKTRLTGLLHAHFESERPSRALLARAPQQPRINATCYSQPLPPRLASRRYATAREGPLREDTPCLSFRVSRDSLDLTGVCVSRSVRVLPFRPATSQASNDVSLEAARCCRQFCARHRTGVCSYARVLRGSARSSASTTTSAGTCLACERAERSLMRRGEAWRSMACSEWPWSSETRSGGSRASRPYEAVHRGESGNSGRRAERRDALGEAQLAV